MLALISSKGGFGSFHFSIGKPVTAGHLPSLLEALPNLYYKMGYHLMLHKLYYGILPRYSLISRLLRQPQSRYFRLLSYVLLLCNSPVVSLSKKFNAIINNIINFKEQLQLYPSTSDHYCFRRLSNTRNIHPQILIKTLLVCCWQ